MGERLKKLFVITAMVISFLVPDSSFAIRCGSDIIELGDTTFEVEMKLEECGKVLKKYVSRRPSGSSRPEIQRWHIRVEERVTAYCYPLTFEDGVLTKILDWTECR